MNKTITNNQASRLQIERALLIIQPIDINRCIDLINVVLLNGKNAEDASGLLLILKDNSTSNAFKSIALFIYKSWRNWSDAPLVESITAFKDLSWLKVRLEMLKSFNTQADDLEENLTAILDLTSNHAFDAISEGVSRVYHLSVGRTPVQEEIAIWKNNFANGLIFADFLLGMLNSPESLQYKDQKSLVPNVSDCQFVQLTYESIHSRGCKAWEIEHWEKKLTDGSMERDDVLRSIFNEYSLTAINASDMPQIHDGLSCHVMGTNRFVTVADWKKREQELNDKKTLPAKQPIFHSRFYIKHEPTPLITAITSLYRGGKFIDQFMDNITSQTCFNDFCELVIIDADSPENESEVIQKYCKQYKNIKYRRINHCIGIYDAWNVGAKMARGDYLTNANLDDLRRHDSFELQAGVLDNLPFVDVVYQDFLYTFNPNLSVDEIAKYGYNSSLPVVTPYNMMDFNSPHNAPMWRKKLHEELGYFDITYKSAGDYEFWMRCLAAKKVFYKINDPHVVYYQNPEGLSTRPDTRGVEEAKRISKTYGRRLVSKNVVMDKHKFKQELGLHFETTETHESSRYNLVQLALRENAIMNKYAHNKKEAVL